MLNLRKPVERRRHLPKSYSHRNNLTGLDVGAAAYGIAHGKLSARVAPSATINNKLPALRRKRH
jgi:hypothetical protein